MEHVEPQGGRRIPGPVRGSAHDGTGGGDKDDDAVPPGGTHVYTWLVPSRAGPGPDDPSSILWIYQRHVDESKDTNAGLIGPIIVTAPGTADPSGRPSDVDREFVTLCTIFDENVSHYLDRNIQEYAAVPTSVHPEDEEFQESNLCTPSTASCSATCRSRA